MSTPPPDLRTRVEAHLADLSPIGRRVALILVDEHDRLGFHSASDIARMAGTTDATVIRTVQRLGYRGIIDLKDAIARRLAPPTPGQRVATSIAAAAPDGDPLDDVASNQLRALSRLDEAEVRAALGQAASAIATARRVHVNARGVSVGIAGYAAAQLERIGVDARAMGSGAGITADDIVAIGQGDVLLVLSTGRQTRWHDVVYERCADVNARVVLMTDTLPAPQADSIVVRAGRGAADGTATHVATIAAVEMIVLAVAAQDPARASTTLEMLAEYRERLDR